MSDYLCEHLLENYLDKGILVLNDSEVKMGLKYVAFISGMKVVKTDFKPTKMKHPNFKDRFFPN